jgi:hypothetical protein
LIHEILLKYLNGDTLHDIFFKFFFLRWQYIELIRTNYNYHAKPAIWVLDSDKSMELIARHNKKSNYNQILKVKVQKHN